MVPAGATAGSFQFVMAGLVPATHSVNAPLPIRQPNDHGMGRRNKSGDDGLG
jgi:hypothetical protein